MTEFRMPDSWYEPPDEVDEDSEEWDPDEWKDQRALERWENERQDR